MKATENLIYTNTATNQSVSISFLSNLIPTAFDEDVDAYFAREVLPYRPGAWIDKSKTKVGYEIPFTRTFYEYEELEPAADIAKRIAAREKVLMEKLQALFGNGGGQNE